MLLPSLLPALALAVATPLLFSVRYLDGVSASIVLERFFCLIGILLFVPAPLPEADRRVREVAAAKLTSLTGVTALRFALLLPVLVLFTALLCGGMVAGGCTIPFGAFLFGGCVSALALGALGFFAFVVSGNWIAGYLAPLCYFMLNLGLGPKLGPFWLFSLSAQSLTEKYWLLAASAALVLATLVVKGVRQRRRGVLAG